ncbi:MAG: RluA family pseudouridine synthase [Clostridia bacterium]|nr:RluA family pseudouridine synthase [Clostridia bacterium]
MKIHVVPEGVRPMPLSKYLTRAWPMLPGWVIRDAMKQRSVRVNGVKCGAEATVTAGDELKIYILDKFFAAPLSVLYEDDDLLAVDKPAGLPVDADQANVGADTLKQRVQAHCPEAQLCHRLDAGTSGVVLCAKNPRAHEMLLAAFAGHQLRKKYVAMAAGRVKPERARLTAWLKKDAGASRVRVFDHPVAGAQEICTEYRLLKSVQAKGVALTRLEVTLITGRTHQIRAHMAHIGHPLLGDDKYGDRELNRRFGGGIRLHAAELTLLGEELPEKWRGLRLTSPAPRWFEG